MATSQAQPNNPGRIDWMGVVRFLLLIFLATLLAPSIHSRGADAQQNRSVEWTGFDVTLELRDDGSYHVTELQEVAFSGGPFRQGFADIPTGRVEGLSNLRIGEVVNEQYVAYERVSSSRYSRNSPNTFMVQQESDQVRIDWSMEPAANEIRTFQIEYDVTGGLRVYPEAPGNPAHQEIRWIPVDAEVTDLAPVRRASMTIVLPEAVAISDAAVYPFEDPVGHTKDGRTWTWETRNLSKNEPWEVGLRFPPVANATAPAWQDAVDRQAAAEADRALSQSGWKVAFLALGTLLGLGGVLGIFGAWYFKGRDPDPGPMPEYVAGPPDGLPAGMVGSLLDEDVDEHDVIAAIADLGQRGVMSVQETT
ncbi:MAG: DUF2207 domain-containing protein, partial [Thermomicrobiales bacterium]